MGAGGDFQSGGSSYDFFGILILILTGYNHLKFRPPFCQQKRAAPQRQGTTILYCRGKEHEMAARNSRGLFRSAC